jgi:hypothetical protein
MKWLRERNIERLFLFLIAAALIYLFSQLYTVLKKDFDEVPSRLAEGTMINLNTGKPDEQIKTLLEKGFYFEDPKDIELARSVVAQGFNTRR